MLPTVAPNPALASHSRLSVTRPRRSYYRPSGGGKPRHRMPIPARAGGSWRAPAGAMPPAWTSSAGWLDSLNAHLVSPEADQLRRHTRIRVETVLDVAAEDARAADSRTGRHVSTAHATVAALLGCSTKTVQRARTLVEQLGYAVTVAAGRYLTSTERLAAHEHHGGHQHRIASERALTVPRSSTNVHLPRRGQPVSPIQLRSNSPRRARARPGGTATRTRSTNEARPLPVQQLAAALASRLPWLARGHIGSLCNALTALGIDATTWTAGDVIEHLDAANASAGRTQPAAQDQRNPLGLFISQARTALAGVESPVRARDRDRQVRQAQRSTEIAAATAEKCRREALAADYDAQRRISDAQQSIRALLAAQRRRPTRR